MFLSKHTIFVYVAISQVIVGELQELSPQFRTLFLIKCYMSCLVFPRDQYPGFQVHSSLTFPSEYLISGASNTAKENHRDLL